MIDTTIVAITMGFGLIALGVIHRKPWKGIYTFLAGLTWMFAGVSTFPGDYDPGWVIITVALGVFLIIIGAMQIAEVKKD